MLRVAQPEGPAQTTGRCETSAERIWHLLRIKLLWLLVCFPLLAGQCSIDTDDVAKATERIAAAIDNAIEELDRNSSAWQSIVTNLQRQVSDLADQLPELRRGIKSDIQNLISYATAALGTEVRCTLDFVGERVKERLTILRARLLGQSVPEIAPKLCTVNPQSIDMGLDPKDRQVILITGYNFDPNRNPQLVLHSVEEGMEKTRDVSSAVSIQSTYQATINLTSSGVLLDEKSVRLELRWNDKSLSKIDALQPGMRPCKVKENEMAQPAGQVRSYKAPLVGTFILGSIDVYNVTTSIELILDQGVRVLAKTDYRSQFANVDPPKNAYEGSESVTYYTAPSGWRIDAILSKPRTDYSVRVKESTMETKEFGPGEAANKISAGIDMVVVTMNPLFVRLVETGNCKAPS